MKARVFERAERHIIIMSREFRVQSSATKDQESIRKLGEGRRGGGERRGEEGGGGWLFR